MNFVCACFLFVFNDYVLFVYERVGKTDLRVRVLCCFVTTPNEYDVGTTSCMTVDVLWSYHGAFWFSFSLIFSCMLRGFRLFLM